jgi:uncharacterized membrane protein YphA (DoxX/SURF4 family)
MAMDVSKLLSEVEDRREFAYEFLRIYLGIGLFARGVLFVMDPSSLQGYMDTAAANWAWPAMVSHYVVLAHLGGGLMLTVGLATRLAAAVQIPVIFGAVFFVHLAEGVGGSQSLEFSALVLVMLLIFAAFGGGALSVDKTMAAQLQARLEAPAVRAMVSVPTVLHHHLEALFENDAEASAAIQELAKSDLRVTVEVHRGEIDDAELVRMGLGSRFGRAEGAIVVVLSAVVGAVGLILIPIPLGVPLAAGALMGAACGLGYVAVVGFGGTAVKPRFEEIVQGVRRGGTLVSLDVVGDKDEERAEEILARHHPSSSQHIAG